MMLAKLVILLIPVGCGFFNSVPVHGAFNFSRNGKIQLMPNIIKRNLSNTACHLKLIQSTLNELLILTRDRGKNVIKLNVLMESINGTLNRTQFLPELIWANKIGRTIVSLIVRTENIDGMILSSYTSTLTTDVDGVDVEISKAPKGCLLPGNNTANNVFYFLLHQLHGINEEKKRFSIVYQEVEGRKKLQLLWDTRTTKRGNMFRVLIILDRITRNTSVLVGSTALFLDISSFDCGLFK